MIEWTGERFIPWMKGGQIHYEHLHRYLFAAALVEGKFVLDLACGEGYGAYFLAERAAQVLAVDRDKETIEHASSRYIRPNLAFRQGSMESIPVEGSALFDVVVCFEALEHTDRHEAVMNEIKRVLKPDGFLIISTPNRAEYTERTGDQNPYHLKELSLSEFLDLLKKHFKRVQLFGQRVYAGSHIWELLSAKPHGELLEQLVEREREDREFHLAPGYRKAPMYFIALASDVGIHNRYARALLVDVGDWLLQEPWQRVRDLEQRIGELKAEHERQIREYKDREQALKEELAEKEEQVRTLREQLKGRESENFALQSQLTEREKALAQLKEQLSKLQVEHDHLMQKYEERQQALESELVQAQKQLQILESRTSELQHELRKREERIQSLEQELAKQREQEGALKRELAEQEQKMRMLQELLAERDNQITSLERQVTALYGSKSWRITAPLRWGKRALLSISDILGFRRVRSWFRWTVHRMELTAARDLVKEGERFRSTGGDPQFIMISSRNYLPTGWTMFSAYVEYIETEESIPRARIYPDNGHGYKEETAIYLPAVMCGRIRKLIRLPDRVVRLRLDPCEAPGSFILKDVLICEVGKFWLGWFILWSLFKLNIKNPRALAGNLLRALYIIKTSGIRGLKGRILAKCPLGREQARETDSMETVHTRSASCEDEWSDYWELSRKISDNKKRALEGFRPKPLKLFSLDETKLLDFARAMRFPNCENPTVSIIIPAYKNVRLTLECLSSILKYTNDIPYEVIVVDDGSNDETWQILSQIKNITLVRNAERKGFLISCNAGAERARGKFTLFLNNDVQVTRNWLRPLVETFFRFEDVGAVGPKILFPDGRLQEAGARIRLDGSAQLIGVFDNPDLPRYNYIREVDYCSGVCLLMRTEQFRALGGFDPLFAPGYCEDIDLCFRIRSQGKRILYNPQSVVVHHLSATANNIASDYKIQCVIRNQQKLCEKWQQEIDDLNKVRLIAFYLPQYHPIPENDLWWGKGFTDWINVVKARPNFVGHYEPHLPADLGFYDLRVAAVMEEQAKLAKRYGIYGFCFYYYWFSGKRLLELPLERMLETGKPNIPFCLCWVNENWTRRWDGREDKILIAQQHSDSDDRAVIKDLMRYMRDQRYIRINGKPLLLIYRIGLFPDIRRTVSIWREECRKGGIGEIYLAMVESFEHAKQCVNPREYGFDASVEFPPHEMSAPIEPPGKLINPKYTGVVSDYREVVLAYLRKELPGHTRFRAVMPSWDNTPRRQNKSYIFAHASPGAYQAWLEEVLEQTRDQNFGDERIVFINAWNEWAEGAHLEPDRRFGHGFLEATRNALESWLLRKDNHK